MRVEICSIMRNAAPYVERYLAQVDALREHTGWDLELIIGEGDSTDVTRAMLAEKLPVGSSVLVEVDHGGPPYGSIDSPERWEQIAFAVRGVLAHLDTWSDVALWVEADLLWDAGSMADLIRAATLLHEPMAPMLFAEGTTRWYDTWGFRADGRQFNAQPPYWSGEVKEEAGYVKIDSCGSCFATPDIASLAKWDGHWPYDGGGQLWLDTKTVVRHP